MFTSSDKPIVSSRFGRALAFCLLIVFPSYCLFVPMGFMLLPITGTGYAILVQKPLPKGEGTKRGLRVLIVWAVVIFTCVLFGPYFGSILRWAHGIFDPFLLWLVQFCKN